MSSNLISCRKYGFQTSILLTTRNENGKIEILCLHPFKVLNMPKARAKSKETTYLLTYLLTYLGPLHEEQRPSTTSRHLTRSWAAFITIVQQVSCCAISVSVLCLQLLRGRPLFLFPCGFHLRAWRVVLSGGFLKVLPIQDAFPLVCLETDSCPALSHSTSFLSLSDHLIPNILLRHILRNVCSRLCTFPVVFHVSQP